MTVTVNGSTNTITGLANLTAIAGTASVAPITLTAGTNLTSPTAGSVEFNGTNFFFTPGSQRTAVTNSFFYRLGTAVTLNSAVATAQSVFGLTNGVALAATTTYEMEIVAYLATSGTTSHTEAWGHSASSALTDTAYQITRIANAGTTASTLNSTWFTTTAGTAFVITGAITTAQTALYWVRGTITTNAATNFNPQLTFSAGPNGTSTFGIGSFMRIAPLTQTAAAVSIGSWT